MDITTVLGLIAGLTFIMLGIFGGGDPYSFINIPSLLITLGGTLAATMVSFSVDQIIGIFGVVKNAFFFTRHSPEQLVGDIIEFAETARREGILTLESAMQDVDDAFLSLAIQLAIDGTEPETLQEILHTELDALEERHKSGARIFEHMGKLAPAFGMIGTLVGLVIMLKGLDNPEAIGPGMATALLTTFYGALLAYLVFIPLEMKLRVRSAEELLHKRIIIDGILAIQSGDNPRIVEQRLNVFITPGRRARLQESNA